MLAGPGIDRLVYSSVEKAWYPDVTWTCPVLFGALTLKEFWLMYIGALLEYSVVFVGRDLGTLTSCVLGLQSLLRPFKWPHAIIPILPPRLTEILEAPIPLLAGLPRDTHPHAQKCPDTIWINLNQPHGRRLELLKATFKAIKLPTLNNLKKKIT